jgi:23S rRNA (cytidine1920-2'-O)/16S rRNA (cytidine1409-2'-O)-methyltransferase
VGKALLGKGGIVKDKHAHRAAIERVLDAAVASGLTPVQLIASPIEGGDGNREFLVHFVNGDGTRAPMPEKRVAEVTGEENKC